MRIGRVGDRVIGIVLSVTAVTLPLLAIYAPLAMAPLLIVAALALMILARRRCWMALSGLWPLVALLAALGFWSLLSALWSILPEHSAVEGLRFLGIATVGLIVLAGALAATPEEHDLIGRSLAGGLLLAVILLAIDRFGGTPIMRFWHPLAPEKLGDAALVLYRFDRGMIVLILTVWAVLFANVRLWLRVTLFLAVAGMTSAMVTEAAILALGAGILVFAAAAFSPRAVAALIIAGLLAVSVAVPLATPSYQQVATLHAEYPWIKWSGIHRLLIWRFGSDRVAERPLLGWGMDASRSMPGGDTDLTTLLPPGDYPNAALAMPLHPHNGTLQLLLELGLPGLALGLAVVAWVVMREAWRTPPPDGRSPGALALIAASLTVGLLSFGIWQEWWQSTLWLAAALFIAASKPRQTIART